jgi:hypothetical protein
MSWSNICRAKRSMWAGIEIKRDTNKALENSLLTPGLFHTHTLPPIFRFYSWLKSSEHVFRTFAYLEYELRNVFFEILPNLHLEYFEKHVLNFWFKSKIGIFWSEKSSGEKRIFLRLFLWKRRMTFGPIKVWQLGKATYLDWEIQYILIYDELINTLKYTT